MKTQKEIAADAAQGIYTAEINNKLNVHTTYLINTGLFTENDRDDVRSRLSEFIWKGAARYNPALSDFATFAECILIQRRKNMIDKARRKKEKSFETISLDVPSGDGNTPLGDVIPDERCGADFSDLIALRDALDYVRKQLTERQRKIFDALQNSDDASFRGLEHTTGIPRSTIAREMERIKMLCIEAGIDR